jgi:hypothetical protein
MPFLLVLLTLAFSAGPAAGQRKQPGDVLSLDVDWLGGAVSYARSHGPQTYWGAQAGIGGGFLNRMLLSGRHFSDEDGPSYEPRDGFEDKDLIEILHVAAFRRAVRSERVSWDAGLRASVFVHFDSSDDDPALPLFAGGYANLMFGNRWLKAGPRLLVGMFTEGRGSHELGVYLVPLSGRVSFGW